MRALERGLGISWEDAYMLASLIVNLEIGEIVNPNKTAKVRIPKTYISAHDVLKALSS